MKFQSKFKQFNSIKYIENVACQMAAIFFNHRCDNPTKMVPIPMGNCQKMVLRLCGVQGIVSKYYLWAQEESVYILLSASYGTNWCNCTTELESKSVHWFCKTSAHPVRPYDWGGWSHLIDQITWTILGKWDLTHQDGTYMAVYCRIHFQHVFSWKKLCKISLKFIA